MDHVEVELPIHDHPMIPLKDGRKGNCCGIKFEAISDGYYCNECDYFFHKTCSNPPERIYHPYDKCDEILFRIIRERPKNLYLKYKDDERDARCGVCREEIGCDNLNYECRYCDFVIHIECVKYPPPEVVDVPQNHDHKLELEMVESCFTCAACGEDGDGYSYKCYECDFTFHVNCEKYAAEVNHPSHSLHPLKLFNGEPPSYTGGTCRLCGNKIADEAFYHCSACNFTVDLHCVLDPPPLYKLDLNTHDHTLTLIPKSISFTCTTCGLNGDPSPYVCLQCDFTAHNNCSGFTWVININRHDHRVSRTSLLGVVNSVCGVCQKKIDWSCGGYSCQRCLNKVFHTKCATREDVSDGIEMKDEPEEDEDIETFKVIDENTIQHFKHKEHNLRLYKSGIFIEERSCKACAYPIYHHSFYSCMSCNFLLHEICANMPKRKRHMISNKQYILDKVNHDCSKCEACGVCFNGFKYGNGSRGLDMQSASVSEPFFHQSHLDHPLFYTSPQGVCSVCHKEASHVLRCVEDNCGYILDSKCALLPYVVKHRVDDHFLSLCYGEEDASGKYWCDICEKETDPKTWFYTCKDCGVTLHTNCVLGDFRALEVGREVTTWDCERVLSVTVRNNSMSRPLCNQCKSLCIFPIILKVMDNVMSDKYYCSINCFDSKYLGNTPMYDYSVLK